MICPFGWKNPLLKGPFPSAGAQGNNKHPSTSTSLVLENLPYTPTIWASFSLYHIQPGIFFSFFSQFLFFSKIWHIFPKKFEFTVKKRKLQISSSSSQCKILLKEYAHLNHCPCRFRV
jgi:hypothetical protein